MDGSALKAKRSSSAGRCGAYKLRASTTMYSPCGSRGAGEWTRRNVLSVGAAGEPRLYSRREGRGQRESGSQALSPPALVPFQVPFCPAEPISISQPPCSYGDVDSLQMVPARGKRWWECSDICVSSPICLSVLLPSCPWLMLDSAGCCVSTATSGAASGWWAAARSPIG